MKRRPRKSVAGRKRRRTGRPSARRRRHASTRTVRLGGHVFQLSLVQRARVSEIKPKKKGR